MADIVYGAVGALAALLAAVAVLLCGAAILHWGRDREGGLVPYIFYPAMLTVVIGVLLSGRNLDLPMLYQGGTHIVDEWATRFTSLFLLFVALERIGRRLLYGGPRHEVPVLLIVALLLLFLTNVFTSGLLGTRPWLSHHHVYTILAGYAALLFTRHEGDAAIRCMRNALFAFLVLSAACIVWRPEMVLTRNYAGLIPGLTVRYAGLGPHPNSLGPMAIVFLLCLWSLPHRARWLNPVGWFVGGTSLLLSQSKTSWGAFIFCACCLLYFRHGTSLVVRLADSRRTLVPAASVALAMLTVSATVVVLMLSDAAEHVTAFFKSPMAANLTTMMGRDRIWEIAVQEWSNNPLFGYGLTMWNEEYRARIGMSYAYNAHNQFFQSLAMAGLVGVTGLLIYALILLGFVLKTTKASQGLTLALFLLMLFQSITEVPLSMTSGYGPVQQVHLLLLMVIASRYVVGKAPRAASIPGRQRFAHSRV
jgi:exopolysaccharide production protein ExoQ